MKRLGEFISSAFGKGLLCGGIAVALLFISWRFVLLAAGIAALYFLLRGKRP